MTRSFWIWPLVLLLTTCSFIEEKRTHTEHKREDRSILTFADQYDQYFQKQFKRARCPGAAVVVVKDTSIIFMKGYGVKEAYTYDSVDANTVFRLGSVSKGFAGVLMGNLVEEGTFNWQSCVHCTLPEFALKDSSQTNHVNVKHLLSHTTGFIRHAYTNLIEDGWTLEQIMPNLKKVDLIAKVGKRYAYQNVAFSLVEEMIKTRTDSDYQSLLEERVFTPAGMSTASCRYKDIINTENKALPHYYSARYKKFYKRRITSKYYNAVAAGGVNASANDMGHYLKVLLGKREDIISKSMLDSIFTPLVNTKREERRYYHSWDGVTDSYYGLGWRILDYYDRELVYHGGYVNEFSAQIAVDRKNDVAICVMFNAPTRLSTKVIPSFLNFYELYQSLYDGGKGSYPTNLGFIQAF